MLPTENEDDKCKPPPLKLDIAAPSATPQRPVASERQTLTNVPSVRTAVSIPVTPSVHETIERVASKAASALDRAQSEASDAQATAYAKFDDLINGEWAESVREEVRARPLAVVGIALLAGLVIGRLI